MPAFTDDGLMVRLFGHQCDIRETGHMREEPIDIDVADAPCEGDLFIRRDGLVANDDHRMRRKRCHQIVELVRIGNVRAEDLGTYSTGQRTDIKGHRISSQECRAYCRRIFHVAPSQTDVPGRLEPFFDYAC